MPNAAPPMFVDSPTVTPYRYGLLTTAELPEITDPHVQNGVQYEPLSCLAAFTTHDGCRDESGRTVTDGTTTAASATVGSARAAFKAGDVGRTISGGSVPAGATITAVQAGAGTATISAAATATAAGVSLSIGPALSTPGNLAAAPGVPYVTSLPFTVYAGFRCHLVGRSLDDVLLRAEAALSLGEQRAVELAYMTGSEGNVPRLADPSAIVLNTVTGAPSTATAVNIVEAFSRLEGFLGTNYNGEGIIHATRSFAPYAFLRQQLEKAGGRLLTHLGTAFVAGGGYSTIGPDGSTPGPGKLWLYATGHVGIWRGEAFINPQPIQVALDRKSNVIELLVERTYTVSHECLLGAVLVDTAL